MFKINMITSLIASSVLLGGVIFVLIKDWRDQINRYFVFYNAGAIGILFTMFLAYAFSDTIDLTQLNKITQMFTILFFGSFLCLSFVFPRPEEKFPVYKSLLLLTPAIIVGTIIIFTDITITKAYFKEGILVRDFKPFYTYYAVIVFLYLSAAIINFIRKYVNTEVQIYKLQTRYLFIGASVALVFAVTCSIFLPRVFNYSALYAIGPSIAAFLMSLFIFYAAIEYNLPDITTAVYKTLMYFIMSAFVFAPICVIVILYDKKVSIFSQTPSYLISGIIVLFFITFSVYIQPIIDKVLKSKQYEFEGILDNFIKEVAYIRDVNTIIKRAVDILFDTLFVQNVFFMMLSNETKTFEIYYYKGDDSGIEPIDMNSPIIRWFTMNKELLNTDRIYTDERSFGEAREYFINSFIEKNIKIILPVYHDRGLIGILCLGKKESFASYKSEEIDNLKKFNQECNINITNAIDYEEWSRGQLVSGIMDLSSEILSKAIPEKLPKISEILFGAFYIPRHRQGIDYFDFIRPSKIGVGIFASDISGRGINNSIYSVILRSAFHSCLEDAHSTFTTMQKLNKALYMYSKGQGSIVKAYYFYYDILSMRLIYTNAGFQPLEIFRVEKNNFESLDTDGYPLGINMQSNYGMGRTNLLRGDIGFLYSRALIDSKNKNGESFGLGQLRSIIKENRRSNPTEISSLLQEKYISFMGLSTASSDILVIIFKIT